jgi:Glycosyl hydrolase family 1
MHLGAVISVRTTLGAAASSNLPGDGRRVTDLIEPIASLRQAGVDRVRISVDWARLEPRRGHLDRDVIEDYQRLLEQCSGLEVWACLFDGDVPAWFDDEGHFADAKNAARAWPRHVEHVAEHFGDRITAWVPMDRPAQFARAAFIDGRFPPKRTDERIHADVVRNLLVAWRDSWRILHGPQPVVLALDLERVNTDPPDERLVEAARRHDRFVWEVWPRAIVDGVAAIPGFGDRAIEDLARSADAIMAWLPPQGAAADWSRELINRLHESIDLPLGIITRLSAPETSLGHLDQQSEVVHEAIHDGIGIDALWASPALGPEPSGALVDQGGVQSPALTAYLAARDR